MLFVPENCGCQDHTFYVQFLKSFDAELTQAINTPTLHNVEITMVMTQPTNKSLVVVGSGADMATGNLIYRLGGIDLFTLGMLQEKGIDSYDKAAKELKDMDEELYFYTPRYRVSVKDRIPSADGLLLVVTPPQASNIGFPLSIVDELKESAPLFAEKKAIVLITTPEKHNWPENAYNDMVQDIKSGLQHLDISTESTFFIPSDLQGANFVELSPGTPWYTNVTLIAALDEVFSISCFRVEIS